MRFSVLHDYESAGWRTDEEQPIVLYAGETVELDPAAAAWINRDSPGTLQPVTDAAERAPDRAPEAPPQDRMVRRPQRRGQDPGGGETINRTNFKAVRDK